MVTSFKMKLSKKSFYTWGLFFAFSCIFLAFYIWLSGNIPYTHDDWDWGLAIGMKHLLQADINSRFVGNFLEVFMTRSILFKTIFLGILYWLIPFLLCLSLKIEHRWIGYLTANGLMLCIPIPVWQQTFGWIAGAANFVTSAACLLLFLHLVKPILIKQNFHFSSLQLTAITILCFLSQMFIENLTLYFIGAAFFLLLYTKIIYKKWSFPCILICVSSILGAVIMFSGQMYTELFSTGQSIDGYRKLAAANRTLPDFIKESLRRFLYEMMPNIWMKPWKITAVICFAMILCIFLCKKKGYWLGIITHSITLAVILFFWKKGYTKDFRILEEKEQWLCAGFAIYIFLTISISLFIFIEANCFTKIWLLLLWCSPCILMVPTLFINALGPRIYCTGEIVMLFFFMQLLEMILEKFNLEKYPHSFPMWKFSYFIIVFIMLSNRCYHFGKIYSDIGKVNKERLEKIEKCKGEEAQKLTLPSFPHSEYLWLPNPVDESRVVYFKDFYGLPPQTKLTFH